MLYLGKAYLVMIFLRSFILCSFLLISSVLSAQYTDQINANRPGKSQGAYGVGKKVLQIETGIGKSNLKHSILDRQTHQYGFEYGLRYGILKERMEINTFGKFRYDYQHQQIGTLRGIKMQANFESANLGIKYLIYDPYKKELLKKTKSLPYRGWKEYMSFKWKQLIPAVSFYVGYDFTNSAFPYFDNRSSGGLRLSVISQSNFKRYDNSRNNWAIVGNFTVSQLGTDAGMNMEWITTVTHGFSNRYAIFGEYQGYMGHHYVDHVFRAGGAFMWNKKLQFDISAGTNFKSTPSLQSFNLGISYRMDKNHTNEYVKPKGAKDESRGSKKRWNPFGFLKSKPVNQTSQINDILDALGDELDIEENDDQTAQDIYKDQIVNNIEQELIRLEKEEEKEEGSQEKDLEKQAKQLQKEFEKDLKDYNEEGEDREIILDLDSDFIEFSDEFAKGVFPDVTDQDEQGEQEDEDSDEKKEDKASKKDRKDAVKRSKELKKHFEVALSNYDKLEDQIIILDQNRDFVEFSDDFAKGVVDDNKKDIKEKKIEQEEQDYTESIEDDNDASSTDDDISGKKSRKKQKRKKKNKRKRDKKKTKDKNKRSKKSKRAKKDKNREVNESIDKKASKQAQKYRKQKDKEAQQKREALQEAFDKSLSESNENEDRAILLDLDADFIELEDDDSIFEDHKSSIKENVLEKVDDLDLEQDQELQKLEAEIKALELEQQKLDLEIINTNNDN